MPQICPKRVDRMEPFTLQITANREAGIQDDCLLFFIAQNASGSKVELLKIREVEIETFFDDNFRHLGYYGMLPRFSVNVSSVKKSYPLHIVDSGG